MDSRRLLRPLSNRHWMVATYLCIPHPEDPQIITLPTYNDTTTIREVIQAVFDKNVDLADLVAVSPGEWKIYTPSDICYLDDFDDVIQNVRQWLAAHRADPPVNKSTKVKVKLERTQVKKGYVSIILTDADIMESLDTFDEDAAKYQNAKRARDIVAVAVNAEMPSPSAASTKPELVYTNAKDHLHAGLPYGNHGPSTALFDQALGRFAYHLANLNGTLPELAPDAHQAKLVFDFAVDALDTAKLASEDAYGDIINKFLRALVGLTLKMKPTYTAVAENCIPDSIIGEELLPLSVNEVKKVFGVAGDATLQAFVVYSRVVTQHAVAVKLAQSNVPTVLVSFMGNMIEMSAVVFTDSAYMTTFFSHKVNLSTDCDAAVLRLARAFIALKLCLRSLADARAALADHAPVPGPHTVTHLFPSPLPEPTCADDLKRIASALIFTGRLRRDGSEFLLAQTQDERVSNVYLATLPRSCLSLAHVGGDLEERVEVVVKFTRQYNGDAHLKLATIGRAPALHACVPVCDKDGPTTMVIMERIAGRSVFVARRDSPQRLLPRAVYEDVKEAIDALHAENIVFGDLRMPNMMVVDSATGEPEHGMLVDFDWPGKHNRARYPVTLNRAILSEWDEGVQPHGLMEKKHDLELLRRLEKLCASPG